jgi:hypothetical protein
MAEEGLELASSQAEKREIIFFIITTHGSDTGRL